MSAKSTPSGGQFAWRPHPAAWALLLESVEQACRANPLIDGLRRKLLEQTGTRLVDWIDHVCLTADQIDDQTLHAVGFRYSKAQQAWQHPAGLFPRFVRPSSASCSELSGLAIKVESVDHFLQAHDLSDQVEVRGARLADLRCAVAWPHPTFALSLVERHGNDLWEPRNPTAEQIEAIPAAIDRFTRRPRPTDDAAAGFAAAQQALNIVSQQLGRSRACELFFRCERRYWQQRNHAARVQYARQQKLGLGWANHDHHTYRSSRECFSSLIGLLESMGFDCRERFYAGAEAGWGAQVLEHPVCGFVVFADVDLSPGEMAGDFAHEGLAPRQELGTVGLWCKLHGEAIMHAGMHHLECQFDFATARQQLADLGVETMEPFTDFPYLRQAFTLGETWTIDSSHLQRLVDEAWITSLQADQFAQHGARGSHLEILERNDGYKGFNQTGISEIISRTDPRNALAGS